MDRPRFSQALVQRRRELGLSTAQASRVLKLKEQVLIALEDGDFESIPKSGYAQGMVSSYARYLGLDAREMVDLFQEDLAIHEADQKHKKGGRGQSRASQYMKLPTQRPAVDDSRRNLLPTSGGRAGDMGDFATTSTATIRSGSVPLVSASRMRDSYGGYDDYRQYDRYDEYGYDDYRQYDYDDDFRSSRSTYRNLRTAGLREQQPTQAQRGYRSAYGSDNASRSRYSSDYRDDRVDEDAMGFEPAYSEEGRRSSHRIQQAGRPRSASNRRRSGSARRQSRRKQDEGFIGLVAFVSESRAIIGVVALVMAIILVVAIVMGVKSCSKSDDSTQKQGIPVSTTVTQTDTGTVSQTPDSISAESQDLAPATPVGTDATATTGEPTQQQTTADGSAPAQIDAGESGVAQDTGEMISTEVSISVASGESTWLEVMVDGESRVADQVLGPWSETYVVGESLTVSADNTGAVSVFENGNVRSFENRASGVGSITIKVPQSSVEPEADTVVSE